MPRSFVSSLLALSLLGAGCAEENGHYSAAQVRTAFAAEGITFSDFNPLGPQLRAAPVRPLSTVLDRFRGVAGLPDLGVPSRTVLRGWNTAVFVYAHDQDARWKYRDLLDTLAAQQILEMSSNFAVKRRANVVVTFSEFSSQDPRLRQPGMNIDPSLYDGTFERRVAAALDRL